MTDVEEDHLTGEAHEIVASPDQVTGLIERRENGGLRNGEEREVKRGGGVAEGIGMAQETVRDDVSATGGLLRERTVKIWNVGVVSMSYTRGTIMSCDLCPDL